MSNNPFKKSSEEIKITICIPTFNRASILQQCLESFRKQTINKKLFQLFISDNASTDNTAEIVKSFTDLNIQYFRQEKNIGHAKNMNFLLSNCDTEYSLLLCDDDFLMPEYLQRALHYLANHEDVVMYFSGTNYNKGFGNQIIGVMRPLLSELRPSPTPPGILWSQEEFIPMCAVETAAFIGACIFETEAIKKCLPLEDRFFYSGEKVLQAKIAIQGRIFYDGLIGAVCRWHENNLSHAFNGSEREAEFRDSTLWVLRFAYLHGIDVPLFWHREIGQAPLSRKEFLKQKLSRGFTPNEVNSIISGDLTIFKDLKPKESYSPPIEDKKTSRNNEPKVNGNKINCLAIFSPHVGATTETFIKTHMQLLNPGRTIIFFQYMHDDSWVDFPLFRIPFTHGGFYRYSAQLEHEVVNIFKKYNVTHILCEYGCYGTDIVELNQRLLHLPIFVHFLGFDGSEELRKPEMVRYYRWMGANVTGVVTVSRIMKERLLNIGLPKEKLHVIPCGVEIPSTVTTQPEKTPCKFLSITRLVPKKGPLYLLQAFALARKSVPEITLDIIGDGPLRAEVEKFIARNHLENVVRLHGFQNHIYVKNMINSSCVYVQHSVTDPETGDAEGLPVVILEASAAGLPVISTLHEGISEEVEHNVTGFLVNELDTDGMASYMVKLAEDSPLRKQMGFAARKKIMREFSSELTINKLRNIMGLTKQKEIVGMQIPKIVDAPQPIRSEHNGKFQKPLRFMQIDTFYPKPIELLYGHNPGLELKPFEEQMYHIQQNAFAAVHTMAPYMKDVGYEVLWAIGNCAPSQIQWTKEHGIDINKLSNPFYDVARFQIEEYKPDILYTTDCMVFDSKFISSLPYKPSLVIGWQASDIPADTDWSEFDIIFSPLSALREDALHRGAKAAVDFLPGFPTWIYESVKDIQPTYDVVFCGQWTLGQHEHRNHLLDILAQESSGSGDNFSCAFYLSGQLDALSANVARYQRGERYGIEMNRALRAGRIGFDAKGVLRSFGKTQGAVRDVAGKETANMRIFETTGCGVFLLTEHHENLSKFFEIGREIESFTDENEMIDKIRYYLSHPIEREEIARRGHARCLRDHSMSKRAAEFDKIIQEKLSPSSEMRTAGVGLSEERERLQPISRLFGFDRGTPIDRYYIGKFLEQNKSFIHGRVLEVGDNTYTQKYGRNVSKSEVLNAVPSPNATIIGNLSTGENIPQSVFDCIILTQTIQMIYDVKSALRNAVKALKPDGTLLLTASGISQISRYDMDRWGEYWRFTDKSLKMLLEEAGTDCEIEVQTFGNVAVAKAYLDGLALEELPKEVLDYHDNDYQLILAAKVKKAVKAAPALPKREKSTISFLNSLVLLYHRIADDTLDSQLLCVSPKNFEAHLKELSENYRVIPLYKLIKELQKGISTPDTVALTFDDGYLDNLVNAVPLLEQYKLHATIFVTSGMVGSEQEFWWDALERIFLTGEVLPESLSVTYQNGEKEWDLRTAQGRLKAYDELCSVLRSDSFEDIQQSVHDLFEWARFESTGRLSHRVVNQEQLQDLAKSPFVEIGSHTVTHTRLSTISPEKQRWEIQESKKQLEAIIRKPVCLLSYPYGTRADFTQETAKIVAGKGYVAGIANIQGSIVTPVDLYAIPRRLVRNWAGDVFTQWLNDENKGRLEAETVSGREERIIKYQISMTR